MVGSDATTATIPRYVTYNSLTPTGGWDLYDEQQVVYDYYRMGPSKIEEPDPRKDPKMWKLWFAEFLKLVCPPRKEILVRAMEPTWLLRHFHRCRSGTIPIREWKMKNWVQALA